MDSYWHRESVDGSFVYGLLPVGRDIDYQSMVEQFDRFCRDVFPIVFVFLDFVDPIVRIVEHYPMKTRR